MWMWRRVRNFFRAERVNCELDEELEAHLEEARRVVRIDPATMLRAE